MGYLLYGYLPYLVVFICSHINASYRHILNGCLFSMPASAVNLYPNPCYWMFPLLNVLPSHCCHKQPHRVIAGLCLGPNWLWMYFGDNLSDCAFSLLWSQSISMNVHRELAVWGSLHDRLCRTHMKTQKKYKACSSGSKIWITMPELETEWRRGEEGPDAGFSLQQRRENSAQTNLRRR